MSDRGILEQAITKAIAGGWTPDFEKGSDPIKYLGENL